MTQCVTIVLNFSTNNLFREGNYNRTSRFWKEPAVCSQAFWHLVQESPHWQPNKCIQYYHTRKSMIINLIYLEQWLYPGEKDIRGIYGSIISMIHKSKDAQNIPLQGQPSECMLLQCWQVQSLPHLQVLEEVQLCQSQYESSIHM